MLGRVVFGSRTCTWTMAAPALPASTADWAICCGVTGTAGLRPGVSAEPVTAHEIMTLRCMVPPGSGISSQVSVVGYQQSGIRYQVSGIRYQVSGDRARILDPHLLIPDS